MKRVFLDANLLFSAANLASRIGELVARLLPVCEVVTSEYAHQEADRNLRTKWPRHHGGLKPLMAQLELVSSGLFPLPVPLAEKDQAILCAAISAGCDTLATGDRRDFGDLFDQRIEGVLVVRVAGLVALLKEAESGGQRDCT